MRQNYLLKEFQEISIVIILTESEGVVCGNRSIPLTPLLPRGSRVIDNVSVHCDFYSTLPFYNGL